MKVEQIFALGLIDDNTEVFIRDLGFNILAHGNWYQDKILDYVDEVAGSFTWWNDNRLYIELK